MKIKAKLPKPKKLIRKVNYQMYPNKEETEKLENILGLQCRLYNTALEERISHYEKTKTSLSYVDQAKELTKWRAYCPSLADINAQSQQNILKRLNLAFQAFFRRCSKGETPGFPRFKSYNRFSGWGYNAYGDGWKLIQSTFKNKKTGKTQIKNGQVKLSGVGLVAIRGRGRFTGTAKTAEVFHKNGKWFLSVSYEVEKDAIARAKGTTLAGAFDWGIGTLLTIAKSDGSLETIENPRWLKKSLNKIKELQQKISIEETKAKLSLGLKADEPLQKGQKLPISRTLKSLYSQLRNIYGKIARQRHDFYHKLTALLVSQYAFLGTEKLSVKKMSKRPDPIPDPNNPGQFLPNGAQKKKALNRNILDAAPASLISMLTTKAEEAELEFGIANTYKVKPTQRCHQCGKTTKKELHERVHECSCGCKCGRDENAAKTLLRWLLEGEYWVGTTQAEVLEVWSGSARNTHL